MITTISDPDCSNWEFQLGAVTMTQKSFESVEEGGCVEFAPVFKTTGGCWKYKDGDSWYLFIMDHADYRRLQIIIKD